MFGKEGSTYQVLRTIQYDAFGKPISEVSHNSSEVSDAHEIAFHYVGQQYDHETALQYSRARYYDPFTHEFISQDPLGFAAGDTNLYRRVGNSPLNATEPSGQIIANIIAGAVGALVGGVVGGVGYYLLTDEADRTSGGFWGAVGGGAVAGAVIGATFGAASGLGGSVVSFVGLTGSAATTTSFAIATTTTGVAAGGLGGFAGGALARGIDDPNATAGQIAGSGFEQSKRGAFYGGVAGLGLGLAAPTVAGCKHRLNTAAPLGQKVQRSGLKVSIVVGVWMDGKNVGAPPWGRPIMSVVLLG